MASIEDHIRKAMEDGQFNDLPGKGKPLRLDENPHAAPEWRMAQHVLRNAGYTLPWIETRQEIETELAAARAALVRSWIWRRTTLSAGKAAGPVEIEWSRALQAFREKITALNKKIFAYNLQTPSERLQLFQLNVEREIESVMGAQTD